MKLYIFLLIFISFIHHSYSQNLLGNIISVSINQPCTDVDASLTNSTEKLGCNLATVLQLGLSPEFSNTTSSIEYTFRAFPDSTGTYQQDFNNNLNTDTLCAQPGTSACRTAIENENLFTLRLELSSIPTRWKLVNTGLTIPSVYYYQTRPYGINSLAPLQTCGIDPYSDVANNADSPYQYAKPVNTITIQKSNISADSTFGANLNNIYADYLLSIYALSVPGQNILPPTNCSTPNYLCKFGETSVGALGEVSNQYFSGLEVLDTIYNRWLNGTLGAGQAVSIDRLFTSSGDFPNVIQYSKIQCTTPIGIKGTGINQNSYTTNVCPVNPLPSFKARNNNIYPSYCTNGPCAGSNDPFCALVAGFQYGFSRCLMSRNAAIDFLTPVIGTGTQSCDENLILSSPYYGEGDSTNNGARWYNCLQDAFLFYKIKYPQPEDLIKSFANAIDPGVCGAYLQNITIPLNGDPTDYCSYPSITHSVQGTSSKACQAPVSQSGQTNPWTQNQFNVADVRQLVLPFQDYNPDDYANTPPVGFCGSSNSQTPGVKTTQRSISPTISTSPCQCTGMNGWQDTVIPVGPLCTVYRLENPGEPVYTLTATVRDNQGNPPCVLELGPVAGSGGSSVYSAACNGTVAAFIINIDKPRGNVLPPMDGYVVICGTIESDNPNNKVTVEPFYGGSDPSGQTDPYEPLGDTRPYRTPLPSTFRDAFRTSGDIPATNDNTNCTKDSLGSCAWWFYVPPNEINQYCEGCNCNGFINYGVQSTASTTTMCNNPAGTCVPGYDIRNYNAKRYDPNATTPFDGFPEKYPTVKTPLFIARQFVDFEIDKGELPENLPPGWDAFTQGYFIQNGYLYSNLNYYSNGNIFVRTKIAVAGQLIAQSTSFSGGQFCYPLASSTSQNYICGAASTNLNNQPYGTCAVYVNGGDGTLYTVVHNTGTQAGTYTILGNCTNGASLRGSFDFSVAPGQYSTVNLPLDYITTTGETVTCTIGLYVAFVNLQLDTIEYQCPKFENKYTAPGTQVYGTVENPTGGLYNPPYSVPNAGNSCGGDNPPWYCFGMRGIGGLMASLWSLLFLILFIVLMIVSFESCNRYVRRLGSEEDLKRKRESKVLQAKVIETDNVIKATKQEQQLESEIDKKEAIREKLVDIYTEKPTGGASFVG